MNKGFTLVEIMATIVILAVVLLIAVPIYNGVREGINKNIYDSKIKEVLAKGESYASENHASVFDIKTLIEAGEISADNETGVYKDPRTGRDMRCDILNALYKENHYEISITESEVCYSKEELENLYGMVELKVYNEENVEIEKLEDTEWIRESKVKVRYEFKEEYKGYEDSIESVIWTGEEIKSCQKENVADCFEYRIETSEIKNVVVSLELTINMDGVLIKNQVQKNILVDLQIPSVIDGSVNVDNEVSTNNERRVEFELSDGSGSGIRSYSIVKNKSCSGDEYEQNKQSASEGIQSTYLGNGDYYICVEDKVGNKSSERDLDEERNQIHVSGVDTSKPVISSFTIKSRKSGYNALETSLTISAKDDGGTSNLEMCVSNTGYLKGCSWEKYTSSKNWTLTGSLDGKERTVYLSIRDSAGNIVNRSAKYTTYKECSQTSKVYTDSSYGSCSKSCGGGLQYRAYAMKDKYTSKQCSTGKDSKTCNTQGCYMYRYRTIVDATESKTSKKTEKLNYYTCSCLQGVPIYPDSTGNACFGTGCQSVSTKPATKCNPSSYLAGYQRQCTQFSTGTITKTSCAAYEFKCAGFGTGFSCKYTDKCILWNYSYSAPVCISWTNIPQYTSQFPSCSKTTIDTCTSNYKLEYDSEKKQYRCVRYSYKCPSGYTLSDQKCYSSWSEWSYTKVTANENREVEVKQS